MKDMWTTGVTVKNGEDGWVASCKWECGDFGQSGYMEGEIATRYSEPTLSQAIDYVLDAMKAMNVKRTDEIDDMKDSLGFSLYHDEEEEEEEEDEEEKDEEQQIEVFKQIRKEALKRGWKTYIE